MPRRGSLTDPEHIARPAVAEQAGPAARAGAQHRTLARSRCALLGLTLGAVAVVGVLIAVALALAP
jgi:hypothetical protein